MGAAGQGRRAGFYPAGHEAIGEDLPIRPITDHDQGIGQGEAEEDDWDPEEALFDEDDSESSVDRWRDELEREDIAGQEGEQAEAP